MAPRILFSKHALEQMPQRGATRMEVEITIFEGERLAARMGRVTFRKNFPFGSYWKNRYYETKQVMPIVTDESGNFIVITVYVFYFGGSQ